MWADRIFLSVKSERGTSSTGCQFRQGRQDG
jgi:hypothetical protein